jgi:hypothetical protein
MMVGSSASRTIAQEVIIQNAIRVGDCSVAATLMPTENPVQSRSCFTFRAEVPEESPAETVFDQKLA